MQTCDSCSKAGEVRKYEFYAAKNTGVTVKHETAKTLTTATYSVNHNPMRTYVCGRCLARGYAVLLVQSAVVGIVWAVLASWVFVGDFRALTFTGLFLFGTAAMAVYEGRDMGSQVGIRANREKFREKGYDSFFTPSKYRGLR